MIGEPISPRAFAANMARFGPWPDAPRIAVAVSGGPDSLALLLLANDWASQRGGAVTALSVDHGLRAEAADEARHVAAICAARGISHRVLRPDQPLSRPSQIVARRARYTLLDDACRKAGLIHLLVGHTADDQAETLALRAEAGSGSRGLAGMPATRSLDHCRLLRPLLAQSRNATAATCRDFDVTPIDDPSNRDHRYARVRVRRALAHDPARRDHLAGEARAAGLQRQGTERRLARTLARHVTLHDTGWAEADPALLDMADAPLALDRLLACIGGRAYLLGEAAVVRALDRLTAGQRRVTVGGCVVAVSGGRLTVTREPGRIAGKVALAPEEQKRWDGRFVVAATGLGTVVHAAAVAVQIDAGGAPATARRSLPVLKAADGSTKAPFLGTQHDRDGSARLIAAFCPHNPLSAAAFAVV